ncbi:hypothetical protein EG329_002042 [Mollisiaceae sp. DMI_Dod_QoI]|nr:hypothetical protein EG329_002042 [Helotiales sp. DMI_Dod_QoI]
MEAQKIRCGRERSDQIEVGLYSAPAQSDLPMVLSEPSTPQGPQFTYQRSTKSGFWPERPDFLDLGKPRQSKEACLVVLPEINIPLELVTFHQDGTLEFSATVSEMIAQIALLEAAELTHKAQNWKSIRSLGSHLKSLVIKTSRRPTLDIVDLDNYSYQCDEPTTEEEFNRMPINIHFPECVFNQQQWSWNGRRKLIIQSQLASNMLENATLWILDDNPVLKRSDILGASSQETTELHGGRNMNILNIHLAKGRWIWILKCKFAPGKDRSREEEQKCRVEINFELTQDLYNARMAYFQGIDKPLIDFCNEKKMELPKDISDLLQKTPNLAMLISWSLKNRSEDCRSRSKILMDEIKKKLQDHIQRYHQFHQDKRLQQKLIRRIRAASVQSKVRSLLSQCFTYQTDIDRIFLRLAQRLMTKCSCFPTHGECRFIKNEDGDDGDSTVSKLTPHKDLSKPYLYCPPEEGSKPKGKCFLFRKKLVKGKGKSNFEQMPEAVPKKPKVPSGQPRIVTWNPENQFYPPMEWCCHDIDECRQFCGFHTREVTSCDMYPYCRFVHSWKDKPGCFKRRIFPPGWTAIMFRQYEIFLRYFESDEREWNDEIAMEMVLEALLIEDTTSTAQKESFKAIQTTQIPNTETPNIEAHHVQDDRPTGSFILNDDGYEPAASKASHFSCRFCIGYDGSDTGPPPTSAGSEVGGTRSGSSASDLSSSTKQQLVSSKNEESQTHKDISASCLKLVELEVVGPMSIRPGIGHRATEASGDSGYGSLRAENVPLPDCGSDGLEDLELRGEFDEKLDEGFYETNEFVRSVPLPGPDADEELCFAIEC